MPKRCQHTYQPVFNEPPESDKGRFLGYVIHRYGEYRRCAACGRCERFAHYTRGGRRWVAVFSTAVPGLLEQAAKWNEGGRP